MGSEMCIRDRYPCAIQHSSHSSPSLFRIAFLSASERTGFDGIDLFSFLAILHYEYSLFMFAIWIVTFPLAYVKGRLLHSKIAVPIFGCISSEHTLGKQGKCITLAIFALRKCLLGCPQTRRKLLVTVTRSFPVCGPVAGASGPYALTAPLPPKVSPAVRRAVPTNPYNLFAAL